MQRSWTGIVIVIALTLAVAAARPAPAGPAAFRLSPESGMLAS
jgi:hypothetical protein